MSKKSLRLLIIGLQLLAPFAVQSQVAFATDFNGHWTGKLMSANPCDFCDNDSKWQSFAAAMSSAGQTLEPITSLAPLEINIVMTATQISLPTIDLVYRGDISVGKIDTETYKIDGEKLTYTCPYYTDQFDLKHCADGKFGSIVGNVVTIYQKFSLKDPTVVDVVRYILNPDGSLRYGHGISEFEGPSSNIAVGPSNEADLFRISVGDFQRQ